jgi:hypothetical protein
MCATSGRHSCIRYDTSQSAAFCSAVLFCWTRKLCIVWRSAKLALRILRDASYQIKTFEFIEGQNPPTVRTVRTQQSLSLERASQCLCRAAQAPSTCLCPLRHCAAVYEAIHSSCAGIVCVSIHPSFSKALSERPEPGAPPSPCL